MIFHENRLPADDSHVISFLIYFEKAAKFEIVVCCKLCIGGALRVKSQFFEFSGMHGIPLLLVIYKDQRTSWLTFQC